MGSRQNVHVSGDDEEEEDSEDSSIVDTLSSSIRMSGDIERGVIS